MDIEEAAARRRIGFLRTSTRTAVQVERQREALIRGWLGLIRERASLARDKAAWFRPYGTNGRKPPRRFCFVLHRMKLEWREADRRRDTTGRPADATVGSTEARRTWFEVLHQVLGDGAIVRVRHRSFDEPALVVPEKHYRELERLASREAVRP